MAPNEGGINIISNLGKILNFAILFFLLYILAKKPLSKYLKNRSDLVVEEMDNSYSKKMEMERRLKEIENRFKNMEFFQKVRRKQILKRKEY